MNAREIVVYAAKSQECQALGQMNFRVDGSLWLKSKEGGLDFPLATQ